MSGKAARQTCVFEHRIHTSNNPPYPMRINLLNADAIDVLRLEDLAHMIPADRGGEVLNYGRGEGQFRVDQTVTPRPPGACERRSLDSRA